MNRGRKAAIPHLGLMSYAQHALLAMGLYLSAAEVPEIAHMYGS